MIDYYQVLGLPFGASSERVRKAYRHYVKHYHPDKHQNSEFFKERFQELQNAYEILINEATKQAYERDFQANDSTATALNKALLNERQKVGKLSASLESLQVDFNTIQSKFEGLQKDYAALKAAKQATQKSTASADRKKPKWPFVVALIALVFFLFGYYNASKKSPASNNVEVSASIKDPALIQSVSTPLNDIEVSTPRKSAGNEPFPEHFESVPTAAFEADTTYLTTGPWYLSDGIWGSSTSDHKTGRFAARLNGSGTLAMAFDAESGVRHISISAAAYGSDGPSTWELWLSRDGGRTFNRTGAPVTTSGPALLPHVFAGVANEPIRIEIRKTSGPDNRLNIDDIVIEAATGPASSNKID